MWQVTRDTLSFVHSFLVCPNRFLQKRRPHLHVQFKNIVPTKLFLKFIFKRRNWGDVLRLRTESLPTLI
jgi:hypothetical protein